MLLSSVIFCNFYFEMKNLFLSLSFGGGGGGGISVGSVVKTT